MSRGRARGRGRLRVSAIAGSGWIDEHYGAGDSTSGQLGNGEWIDLAALITGRPGIKGGLSGADSWTAWLDFQTDIAADPSIGRKRLTVMLGANNYASWTDATSNRTKPNNYVSDIARFINAIAPNPYFRVYAALPKWDVGGTQATGTTIRNHIDYAKGLLAAAYGTRYADPLPYLQARHDGSANDLADIAAGLPPRSLMKADGVHLSVTSAPNPGALMSGQEAFRNFHLQQIAVGTNWIGTANGPPVVAAGADQAVTLPAGITLTGAAVDDGLPWPYPASPGMSYAWSKVSGPGTVTFGTGTALTTTAAFSAAGTYVLRLTASDGALSGTDELTVTVTAAPSTADKLTLQSGGSLRLASGGYLLLASSP